MGAVQKAKITFWEEIPSTKEEKKLILKIDWFILSFCCLAYFCNYLDRSNINNAYVSGMKVDLNMSGNQINKIATVFTCGFVHSRGLLTLGTYKVSTVNQIYAIRFFQGFFEASSFARVHYILGSWYTESELAKRSGIFTASGLAGTLFSGFLQSSIHKSMDGLSGISGWRWIFIIDFLITLPVAAYGFVCFLDTPVRTKAFYLTASEKRLATDRLPKKSKTRKGVSTIGITTILITAVYIGIWCAFIGILTSILILAYRPESLAAFFAWANLVCRDDDEELFYSANFVSHFSWGMWATIGVSIALALWTILIRWFQMRDLKRQEVSDESQDVAGS
ncbi:major facilitator superfamily domain-containing protein [Trichophaea hybrida]|nr:major facilitator superfamily domain-containing protein [Trichophaea hybrida]